MARRVFLVALLLLALVAIVRVDFGTDITNFMPDDGEAGLATISRELATGDLSRTMILTIGASSATRDEATQRRIAAATPELVDGLRALPGVAWVRDGAPAAIGEDVWDLYFPRRFYFASVDPETEIARWTSDADLARRALAVKHELELPTGLIRKRTVAGDPLGLFDRVVDRIAGRETVLRIRAGHLWSEDGFAVIFIGTRSPAFASKPQAELLAAIDGLFEQINARNGGGLLLESAGANRFAIAAESAIRGDVRRISMLSTLGVIALFIAFFPSVWRVGLVLLPAAVGVVVAALCCLVLFGRLDGLTLAFGTALLGVTIDYPIHLLNHQGLLGIDVHRSVSRLGPTLALGAGTTVAGFAGFALTSFPGFREIGCFAMIAVLAALATTLFAIPLFPTAQAASPRLAQRAAVVLDRGVGLARAHRRALATLPLGAVAVALFGLPRLGWQDDLAALNAVDPALAAEDTRVRERATPFETGRFALVVGADEQGLLEANERLQAGLSELVAAGSLDDVRSLRDFLWSESLQRRNLEGLRAVPDLDRRVAAAFAAAGFRPGTTAAFAAGLAGEQPAPLRLADFDGTAIEALTSGLVVRLGDRLAAITQLRGVRDTNALQAAVDAVPGAYFLDQRRLTNDMFARFRWRTLRQIGIGCGLVLVVLFVRYRRWRPALAAFLPSVVVSVLVLAIAALRGQPVNLLHAVSLAMVMGMGVDYGIFLVDGARSEEPIGVTALSLLLSCLTTVLVFGMLTLSSNPALAAIGWTTGLGVLLSMVFAPISLVLLERGE